jgi:hypothetical protein
MRLLTCIVCISFISKGLSQSETDSLISIEDLNGFWQLSDDTHWWAIVDSNFIGFNYYDSQLHYIDAGNVGFCNTVTVSSLVDTTILLDELVYDGSSADKLVFIHDDESSSMFDFSLWPDQMDREMLILHLWGMKLFTYKKVSLGNMPSEITDELTSNGFDISRITN